MSDAATREVWCALEKQMHLPRLSEWAAHEGLIVREVNLKERGKNVG